MQEVQGDLLKMFQNRDFDIIAHGANCFCLMGAGIAQQIAQQFPGAKQVDDETLIGSINKLGNISIYMEGPERMIFNLYTQYRPGKAFDYTACRLALRKMAFCLEDKKHLRIGLPRIGCGIGGGSWDKVQSIIQRELRGFHVTIVNYKHQN